MPMILCCYHICGPCCMCVTCLPTTFQSSLMPLNPSVYGSKLGEYVLHVVRTLLVFLIGGNANEFISSWLHLGHILTTDQGCKVGF